MSNLNILDAQVFSEKLYNKMMLVNPGIEDLELYEFRYALDNMVPEEGWSSIPLEDKEDIEKLVNNRSFYLTIHLKPKEGKRIVLDEKILQLTRILFLGLVTGHYHVEWIRGHFYFDIRGFYFLHRTEYFTKENMSRFEEKPFIQFERKQKGFEKVQSIGYKAFSEANLEVDQYFIDAIQKLVKHKPLPVLIAIAGQTAAGKTEIVSRLRNAFGASGKSSATIEMDNFLTDRDEREAKGIDTLGQEAYHYEILRQCIQDISQGKSILIPRYDFVWATSSHDIKGILREGCTPVEVVPGDINFIEGNYPFLFPEVAQHIHIKALYLTDDAIRMKRKWRRDVDYRKKYEPTYFLNRYFKEQFLMAEKAYLPQMELCDMLVDTTNAAIWVTPDVARFLDAL